MPCGSPSFSNMTTHLPLHTAEDRRGYTVHTRPYRKLDLRDKPTQQLRSRHRVCTTLTTCRPQNPSTLGTRTGRDEATEAAHGTASYKHHETNKKKTETHVPHLSTNIGRHGASNLPPPTSTNHNRRQKQKNRHKKSYRALHITNINKLSSNGTTNAAAGQHSNTQRKTLNGERPPLPSRMTTQHTTKSGSEYLKRSTGVSWSEIELGSEPQQCGSSTKVAMKAVQPPSFPSYGDAQTHTHTHTQSEGRKDPKKTRPAIFPPSPPTSLPTHLPSNPTPSLPLSVPAFPRWPQCCVSEEVPLLEHGERGVEIGTGPVVPVFTYLPGYVPEDWLRQADPGRKTFFPRLPGPGSVLNQPLF